MASSIVEKENLTLHRAHGVNRLPSKSGTAVAPKAFQANNAPTRLFTPRRALGDINKAPHQQPSQTPATAKKPGLSLMTPNLPKPLGVRNVENGMIRKSSLSKTPGLKKPHQKTGGLRQTSMTPAQIKRRGPKEVEVKVHTDRSPSNPDNLPDMEAMHIHEDSDDHSIFPADERPSFLVGNFLRNWSIPFMASSTHEPALPINKFMYEQVRRPSCDEPLDLELNLPDLCSDLGPVDLPDLVDFEPLFNSSPDIV
ncbi:uncharacterized protein LOC118414146 isoform X1 [Branchiostoma floridae]|uniref:Uncharacterized protein LOC118414146 isoform X1 n=1 Tax=Branchiostoma floridae TaxID=7739 RepID=A0A9J7L0G3_BRAFL|nr:uncharacterized protein LOC118414146 isoform X1 [Branchiostoma floridae]